MQYDLHKLSAPWYNLPIKEHGYREVSRMPFISGGDRYQVMFTALDDRIARLDSRIGE